MVTTIGTVSVKINQNGMTLQDTAGSVTLNLEGMKELAHLMATENPDCNPTTNTAAVEPPKKEKKAKEPAKPEEPGFLTAQEIADRMGMPKDVAYGLLRFLDAKGLVNKGTRSTGATGKPFTTYKIPQGGVGAQLDALLATLIVAPVAPVEPALIGD